MAYEYLEKLELSDSEKLLLLNTAASTPRALYAMLLAAPEDFDREFGRERRQQLVVELRPLLSGDDLHTLASTSVQQWSLGAHLNTPAPLLKPAKYDLQKREALFQEWHELKELKDHSPEQIAKLKSVEAQFNTLLEPDQGG